MPFPASPAAVMGFYFFPRGGSAQVARYLCRALAGTKWAPTLFAGSLGGDPDVSNARRFFSGIRCQPMDYSPARARWAAGGDPTTMAAPMHASYEHKPGVPDRIFVDVGAREYARQVSSWTKLLAARASGAPQVVHLHHLTPIHEAVRAVWPTVPVVTHLHGTELKMLAAAREGTLPAGCGRFTDEWVERMRRWAGGSERIVVVSSTDHQLALDLLPVDPARVTTVANGVDTEVFAPRVLQPAARLARWKRWLVDDPRGWVPGGSQGSIRYTAEDLSAFTGDDGRPVPVVLFAGRFMRFKRVQLLIEAHHAMRSTTPNRSVLVIVGGFPGEWEGEHPFDTVRRLRAEGVFFVGWRDHDDLAEILGCGDVFAAPSVDEPFGLVYLEAMSAGLPPLATNTGGPSSFINIDPKRPTGWLVPADHLAETARVLAEAVSDGAARADRGRRAAQFVRDHYSWTSSANAFANLYEEVVDDPARLSGSQLGRPTSGVA